MLCDFVELKAHDKLRASVVGHYNFGAITERAVSGIRLVNMSRALSKALRATSRVESLRVVRSINVKPSSPRFRPLLSSAPLRFVPAAAMSSAPMISAPECLFHPLDFPHKTLMGPGPSNAPPRVLGASALPLLGHLHPEFTQVGVLPYGLASQFFLLRVCALFCCWLLYCLVCCCCCCCGGGGGGEFAW